MRPSIVSVQWLLTYYNKKVDAVDVDHDDAHLSKFAVTVPLLLL